MHNFFIRYQITYKLFKSFQKQFINLNLKTLIRRLRIHKNNFID